MKKFLIMFFLFSFVSFSFSTEELTEKQKLEILKGRLIKSLKQEISIKQQLIKCLENAENKQELKKCFEQYAKKMKPIWMKKKKYWEKYQQKHNKKESTPKK